MTRRRIIALLSLVLVAGIALAVALTVQGKPRSSRARFKPCGTYVGIMGAPYRWTFTIIPDDPSGNTFTAIMEYAEAEEDFSRTNDVFTAVRTGKNTYDTTGVQYKTTGGPFLSAEVLAIVVSSGQVTFSDDGNIMTWSGTFAHFLPEQDIDPMDGFPDEDEVPFFCFEAAAQGKRVHVIPPYPPT